MVELPNSGCGARHQILDRNAPVISPLGASQAVPRIVVTIVAMMSSTRLSALVTKVGAISADVQVTARSCAV